MIIFLILSLLLFNAVSTRRDISIFYTQIAIILAYCILDDIFSLTVITKGIGLHGDLLLNTNITQQLYACILFIYVLIWVIKYKYNSLKSLNWVNIYENYIKPILILTTILFLVLLWLKSDKGIIYSGNQDIILTFCNNIKESIKKGICCYELHFTNSSIYCYLIILLIKNLAFIILQLIKSNWTFILLIIFSSIFSWAFWTNFYSKHFLWEKKANILKYLNFLWEHKHIFIKKLLLVYILLYFCRFIILNLIILSFTITEDFNICCLKILFSMYFIFYTLNIINEIVLNKKKFKMINYNLSNPTVIAKVNFYNITLFLGNYWIVSNYTFYYYITIGILFVTLILLLYFFFSTSYIHSKGSFEPLQAAFPLYKVVAISGGMGSVASYIEVTDWADVYATVNYESEIIAKSKFIRSMDPQSDPIWSASTTPDQKNRELILQLRKSKIAAISSDVQDYLRRSRAEINFSTIIVKETFLSDKYTGLISTSSSPTRSVFLFMAPRNIEFHGEVRYISSQYSGRVAVNKAFENISTNFGVDCSQDHIVNNLCIFTPLTICEAGIGKVLRPGGLDFDNYKRPSWSTYYNTNNDNAYEMNAPLKNYANRISEIENNFNRTPVSRNAAIPQIEIILANEEVEQCEVSFDNWYNAEIVKLIESKKNNFVDQSASILLNNNKDDMYRFLLDNPHNPRKDISLYIDMFLHKDKTSMLNFSKEIILENRGIDFKDSRDRWFFELSKTPSYNTHVISKRGSSIECFELQKTQYNANPLLYSYINMKNHVEVTYLDKNNNKNIRGVRLEYVKDFNISYSEERECFIILLHHISNRPNYSNIRQPD